MSVSQRECEAEHTDEVGLFYWKNSVDARSPATGALV